MQLPNKKIIVTDCDGCLLDWWSGFFDHMYELGYERLPNTDHDYTLRKKFSGNLSESQIIKIVKEYNSSDKFQNLQPHKDAKTYVKKLADLGFKFHVVSSFSDRPEDIEKRRKNLINVFGDCFEQIIGLSVDKSKQHALRSNYGDTEYLWIEDHFKNAEAGHEEGLRAILIDMPYNRQYNSSMIPRTSYENPWRDIYYVALKHYGHLLNEVMYEN